MMTLESEKIHREKIVLFYSIADDFHPFCDEYPPNRIGFSIFLQQILNSLLKGVCHIGIKIN